MQTVETLTLETAIAYAAGKIGAGFELVHAEPEQDEFGNNYFQVVFVDRKGRVVPDLTMMDVWLESNGKVYGEW